LTKRNFGEAEKSKAEEFFKTNLSDDLSIRRASGVGVVHTNEEFLKDLINPEKIYHEIRTDLKNIYVSEEKIKLWLQCYYIRSLQMTARK
jgi:hypothetical protein